MHTSSSPGTRTVAALLLWAASLGSALAAESGAEWEKIGEKDGITSYLRPIQGEPIHAARGVMTVDVPACQLISFYVADDLATTWVDMLVEYEVVELAPHRSLVWQHYDMPWPVTDRDFLLEVSVTRPDDRTVLVTLQSTTDPRYPPPTDDTVMVRGRMTPSTWTFTQVAPGRTKVDMVGHADPAGSFPAWLVNMIQHNFPYNTLSAFVREAKKTQVPLRPECASW